MNLLGIDTSSDNISLAIMRQGEIVVDFNQRVRLGASKIIPYIDRCLKKLSLSLRKIDAFVVGRGPGSFTGLRVSFSIIKGFSLSLSRPVISLGSFFSCAYPFRKTKERIAVVADARRNLVYAASFRARGDELKAESKEKLINLEDFIAKKKDYFFITYDSYLRENFFLLHQELNFYPRNLYPQAKYLLLLAKDYYRQKKFTPLDCLKPLYLYSKTCQIARR